MLQKVTARVVQAALIEPCLQKTRDGAEELLYESATFLLTLV